MDEIFGVMDFNQTIASSSLESPHIYTANEYAVILGALSAAVAGIVYSWRNVKSSSCCGGLFKCQQRTVLTPSKESMVFESSNV
tara:strand:- start:494 stop:745 length:252 start_codon:yes stop_codon:yes gene_type:complete